jgi:hypothetical protein
MADRLSAKTVGAVSLASSTVITLLMPVAANIGTVCLIVFSVLNGLSLVSID